MVQIIAKVILTGALAVVAVATLYVVIRSSMWIWQHDIDVKTLIRVDRWLDKKVEETVQNIPVRETDGIYQDGKLVARVESPKIDAKEKIVYFEEIYQSKGFDHQRPFNFQQFTLRVVTIEMIAGVELPFVEKGQIMKKVKCEILEVN